MADTPQTDPNLQGDDYLTPPSGNAVLTEEAVAAEFADSTPGLEEDEGTPEGPRQEAQEPDAGGEAPEPETEEAPDKSALLSDEDTATLREKYGDDSPASDPKVRREVSRAISALREKDVPRIRALEQDQALKEQYDQALRANPDLRDAFVRAASGQQAAPQGQAGQPQSQAQPQEGIPTLEEFRAFDTDKLHSVFQRQDQQIRQLQEQMNAPRLADQLAWQTYRDGEIAKLEQRGYAGARQFANALDAAVAAESGKPGADRLSSEQIYENALWSIPEARKLYTKAQVDEAVTSETTRAGKAAREAPAHKQSRPVKRGGRDTRQFYDHVRNLNQAGVNMDEHVVDNDSIWTDEA